MGSSSSATSRTRTPRRTTTSSLPWTVRIKLAAIQVARSLPDSIQRPTVAFLGELLMKPSTEDDDGDVVRSADITMDASRGLWARVFFYPAGSAIPTDAAGAGPLPVFVYFHGGGFVHFSPSSRPYDALCRRLCRELRAVVVSLSYRKAPEHRCPAAYDDGVAALRYLDENPLAALPLSGADADLIIPAVDLSSCFLVGDSSGANMVHHVAQRWAASSTSSSSAAAARLRLAGAVLIQPFFGGEERTEAELTLDGKAFRGILSVARADHFWREFLPQGATRDHPAARVCGDGVELADTFPPAMVVTGGFDLLRDWHAKYVDTLRGKGELVTVVDYPDAFHGFYAFPEMDDSGRLVEDMKLFVHDHRSKPRPLHHLA